MTKPKAHSVQLLAKLDAAKHWTGARMYSRPHARVRANGVQARAYKHRGRGQTQRHTFERTEWCSCLHTCLPKISTHTHRTVQGGALDDVVHWVRHHEKRRELGDEDDDVLSEAFARASLVDEDLRRWI